MKIGGWIRSPRSFGDAGGRTDRSAAGERFTARFTLRTLILLRKMALFGASEPWEPWEP